MVKLIFLQIKLMKISEILKINKIQTIFDQKNTKNKDSSGKS